RDVVLSGRRRNTRLVSDWSSDVCSSDLHDLGGLRSWPGSDCPATILARPGGAAANQAAWMAHLGADVVFAGRVGARDAAYHRRAVGRAAWRERGGAVEGPASRTRACRKG